MYNRYVRNDSGAYQRIPVPEERAAPRGSEPGEPPPHPVPPPSPHVTARPPGSPSPLAGLLGKNGLLSGILDKLKLSEIDTGDLLLLVLLFLLFRDGEDDELLIALGLLLIL